MPQDILQKVINANDFKNGSVIISQTPIASTGQHVIDPPFPQTAQITEASGELLYRFNADNVNTSVLGLAAETKTIIEAVAGQQIEVVSYVMVASAASTVTFKSDTTAISSGITLAAKGDVSATNNEGLMRTATGEALKITNSAGNLNGHISYKIQ